MIKVGLSQEDIERMVQEAEDFAKDDLEIKEKIEAKNQLEALIYQTRSSIQKQEFSSKLSTDDIDSITNLLSETDSWLINDDYTKNEYESKLNELNSIIQPIMMKAMGQSSEGFHPQESTEESVGPTIDEID